MKDLFDDTTLINSPVLPFKFPTEDGYSYKWNEALQGFDIHVPNGYLFYSEHFINEKISNRTVEYFLENETNNSKDVDWHAFDKETLSEVKFKNIIWQHDKIKMYGKEMYLPRYSAWYGDDNQNYTYSGIHLTPKPWNKGLQYLRDRVEEVAKVGFNSVLINWYRDGLDHIGWHTDAEPELGENPVIASLNFGASRDFVIRKNDKSEKLVIPLKHGTLLVMGGALQHHWEHSVPQRKKVKDSRFNLTFRVIKHS